MKFETKLNKIIALTDSTVKLSKLYSLAFQVVPHSINQLEVNNYINELLKKGITFTNN